MTLTSATGDVTVGTPSVHTVTINETAPTVILDTGSSMVAEGGTANVEVELDGDLHESDVVVSFTIGGTAVAGTDYTSPESSITIPAGMRSAMITFNIDADQRYEGADETVVLTLTSATGDVTVGTPSVHTVTIDETAPTVIFDIGSSTVAEGDSANVVVELEGDLHESDVVVSFTVGGTAVAGADFTSPVTSVTIPAGMRSAMITFNIATDQRYEGADETVVLTLTSATGDVTVGTPSVHTVTIDETAPTVIFDTGSSMVVEGGTANVVVELDGDLHESDVVVSFTVGGTATPGTDFTAPMTTVTIPAGMRSAMITFNIDADQRYEGAADTVVLTLTSATGDVTVGTPSVHTVTIDEIAPTVIFDTGSSMVVEGGTANVLVELDGDLHESDVVVSFTIGGTATPGTDFTAPMTTVTIPAGMRSAMITFNIDADQRDEGADETVVLTLTSATGDVTVGTPSIHTVTIMDNDDPQPELEVVTATVSLSATSWYEGDDDALVVTFELADGVTVSNDVTIDYELEFPTIDTDGNRRMAADVADFVGATTGTVLIPAGESSAKIEIASSRPVGYRYLGFNDRGGRGPFVNVAFRQAVATLIDTEQIVRDVLQGVTSPIYSVVPEGNGFWHNPDLPRFGSGLDGEARINEAVRILAAGGYTWTVAPSWDTINGRVIAGEGFKDSAGQEVRTFEILSVEKSFDPFRFEAANLIARWLNEAGIPTEVTTSSIGTIVSKIQDYDAWILGWDIETYPRYHLVNTFTTGAFYNLGRWFNDEYDALAAQFPTDEPTDTMELARVRELAFQMQAILARELPYVVLFPNPPTTGGLALAEDSVSEEPELVGIRLTGARVVSGAALMVADEPAIITILDNDAVEYVIEGAETVAEEDGVYVARLRRRGYTISDASVDYMVIGLGPNAADHNDFVSGAQLPTGAVTFAGHDAVTFVGHDTLSSEIRIPLMDDAVSEGRETFRIVVARGVSTLRRDQRRYVVGC